MVTLNLEVNRVSNAFLCSTSDREELAIPSRISCFRTFEVQATIARALNANKTFFILKVFSLVVIVSAKANVCFF